jgi:transposase
MEVLFPRSAGLDVHKKSVTACVVTPEGRETRTFPTMMRDLLKLGDWLVTKRVTHVAMESTGVYWKPIYNVLEGYDLTLLLANAERVKNVPGRKTDVKDAEWIADLMRHGLLQASFIPERGWRETRELTRHRRKLVQQRAATVNRIQHVLEGANIKLASVASDVMGVSGRAMIEAMIGGANTVEGLARLARGKLREKRELLEAALEGLVGDHQRLLLASLLRQIDFLDGEVGRLDEAIGERLRPFDPQLALLFTVPGIGRQGAEAILAEVGPDMSRFPTADHLASWACMCPGNRESAGKRMSGRTRHGNTWLRTILVETGWAASRTRETYLAALYRRLVGRRGKKRALIAVGHAQLVMVYMILSRRVPYAELGGNYFEQRGRDAAVRSSVARLERLGFKVTLEEVA